MRFECGDLDRALANPDLMAEAREHLRGCAACRNEYRIWNEISNTARQLHTEWESPGLWTKIQRGIEAERPAPRRRWMEWKVWAVAAAAAILIAVAILRWAPITMFQKPESRIGSASEPGGDFLTEQALRNVETNEAAYRRSIDELSRLAEPKLESGTASPIVASYREKLLMIDSEIAETRSNVSQNRFNVRLQRDLAELYRDKQQTLREILTGGQSN
ncbi:MAG: hypothetical protein JO051_06720 [Acidobacteriaceae bacterium]|nr:hypothetical protein [Acidobacteriaceae bacterium]